MGKLANDKFEIPEKLEFKLGNYSMQKTGNIVIRA